MIAAVANAISFWFIVESSIVAEWSDNGVILASKGFQQLDELQLEIILSRM